MRPRFLLALPAFLAMALALGACSAENPLSPYSLVDPSGKHPAGWVALHQGFAGTSGSLCQPCHGEALDGGISGVSCFSSTVGDQSCHANGPGFHPLTWLDRAFRHTLGYHATAYSLSPGGPGTGCRICHTPPALDADPVAVGPPAGGKCVVCHFDLEGRKTPSGSSYTHGQITGHHSQISSAQGEVCVNCHLVGIRLGYLDSCHNCHGTPSSPHGGNWLNKNAPSALAFHGNAYDQGTTIGGASCADCHTPPALDALPVGGGGGKCVTCHFTLAGSRTPGGWTHPDNHDNTTFTSGQIAVCRNCHDTNLRFGNQSSCHNCH